MFEESFIWCKLAYIKYICIIHTDVMQSRIDVCANSFREFEICRGDYNHNMWSRLSSGCKRYCLTTYRRSHEFRPQPKIIKFDKILTTSTVISAITANWPHCLPSNCWISPQSHSLRYLLSSARMTQLDSLASANAHRHTDEHMKFPIGFSFSLSCWVDLKHFRLVSRNVFIAFHLLFLT